MKRGTGVIVGMVALVAVLSAVYWGWVLSARRAPPTPLSNERAAYGVLGALVRAEEKLHDEARDYWTLDVAGLSKFGLIDGSIAGADASHAREPKSGYLFAAVELDAHGSPYTCIPVDHPTGNRQRFCFCAFPARYEQDGRLTYLVAQLGLMWSKDTRGAMVRQFPKDPAADGWMRLK